MFSGVPKWFLQNYGPTEAYRCALFRLNLGILLVEEKYYPGLRRFFQVVKTADERQIALQSGRATASK
jgi:hypothetical protein